MKKVNIYKAWRTVFNVPIEPIAIVIDAEMPNYKELHDQDNAMTKEAEMLEGALYFTLPGGIYDRLLGAMLTRKASHFRVAHGKEG